MCRVILADLVHCTEYDYYTGGQNDPSNAPGSGFHPVWGDMLLDSSGECAVPVAKRFVSPTNGNGVFWL